MHMGCGYKGTGFGGEGCRGACFRGVGVWFSVLSLVM